MPVKGKLKELGIMQTSARDTVPADVMLRFHLYADNKERMRHFGEIQSIANELHLPIAQIARTYEEVLDFLSARAKVTDFLPVLVSKKVRERCRRPRVDHAK
jgi:hypothetical protein